MTAIGTKSTQQQAVYDAQATTNQWGKVESVEEAQQFVDSITSEDWWVKNYPYIVRVEVEAQHGNIKAFSAMALEDHHSGGGVIFIPRVGATVQTILHEVAHTVSRGGTGHDGEWAKTFLTIVYFALGGECYMELYQAFTHSGVEIA